MSRLRCGIAAAGARGNASLAALLLPPPLSACVSAMPLQGFADARPAMRPETFFAGHTRGWGVVESRGGRQSRRFTVAGEGDHPADGSFRLRQAVTWADTGKTENCEWRLFRDGTAGYRGSLTDAKGAVTGDVAGSDFHLRYRMADPDVRMEQHLYLQADGRSVLGSVTALGAPVAQVP